MFQKNQQLNKVFDQAEIQQLHCSGVAQSYLHKLLMTLKK